MAATLRIAHGNFKGSITVTVADAGGDGGVLSRAWVSLYATPEGSDSTSFDGARWLADTGMRRASKCVDSKGQVTFTQLELPSYIVKYEHHPTVYAQWVDVK